MDANEINSVHSFSWLDYLVFSLTLGVSAFIGIYFGCFGKRQNTPDEYLKGGRKMQALPIAISLVASQISTNTLLGAPVDVFTYGSNYLWLGVSILIECSIAYYVFLPVFFKLQVTSIFEYLQLRFDKRVRALGSFINLLSILVYSPSVIYLPSLAFSQVTGVNLHLIAAVTSCVCIFYTAIGGIKTVVWTDTVQFFIMAITFIVVFCLGLSKVNGISHMFQRASIGHRVDIFDFSFDPFLRDSFGALIIGGTVYWLSNTAVDQMSIQKLLSLPKFEDVKKSIIFYAIGLCLIQVFALLIGLLLYSRYWNCDPLLSGEVSRAEQLIPYFVMEISRDVSGLPGIFTAGVFSAGLSSFSACLNTMSAIIYHDYVLSFVPKDISEESGGKILKLLVVVTGVLTALSVLILEKLGRVFSTVTALLSGTVGPTLGMYIQGVLIPMVNSEGAFYSGILGLVTSFWIIIQNQRYQNENVSEFLVPTSLEGCNISTTYNSTITTDVSNDDMFLLYRISFWYISVIGMTVTVVSGVVISCFTKHDKTPLSLDHLSPLVHAFVKQGPTRHSKSIIEEEQDVRNTLM
ncbi:hypothetical protein FQA39_LY03938 [Lamprigera yunnana]|nr:hypothetical protein FQA39_LY03938 [Lamprigera yunnana]